LRGKAMAIELKCSCGAKLKVKQQLAGKKIKCPKCSATITVPAVQSVPDSISVSCKCGKSFQAKASMAGKSFQCISCNRTISIPPLTGTVQQEPDPFASNQSSYSHGSPFDSNFPDMGTPTASYVPYHAPITDSITNKTSSSNKTVPDYRGIPTRPGITLNFNQDVLIIVTAVLCIMYGLGQGGQLPFRILPMITSGAIFTVGGALSVGKSLIELGILVAGVGLLTQQEWTVSVGQTAACMYFVFALISIAHFVLAGSMEGYLFKQNYLVFGAIHFSMLIVNSIVPALLLYVTFRESNRT